MAITFFIGSNVGTYICGQGKIGYITREKTAPCPADPSFAGWDAENFMVMTYLLQVFELNLKLGDIRREGITQFRHSLKRISQDLNLFDTYEWKSIEDQKHYRKAIEDGRIYKFLVGLNVEFDEVNDVFLKHLTNPTRHMKNLVASAIIAINLDIRVILVGNFMKNHWKISKERERDSHQHAYNATIVDSTPFNKEKIDQIIKLLETNSPSGNSSVSLAQLGKATIPLTTKSRYIMSFMIKTQGRRLDVLRRSVVSITLMKFQLVINSSPSHNSLHDVFELDVPIANRKVNFDWALYQVNVKNVFLDEDLEEEVFMDLLPGFEESLHLVSEPLQTGGDYSLNGATTNGREDRRNRKGNIGPKRDDDRNEKNHGRLAEEMKDSHSHKKKEESGKSDGSVMKLKGKMEEMDVLTEVKVAVVSFGQDEVDWYRWSHNRKKVESWEDLKVRMFKFFRDTGQKSLGARLIRIQQDGSYNDYVKKFVNYSAPLPYMAESVLRDAFLTGLEPALQAEAVSRHPQTLEDCMKEAQLVNDRNLALKLARIPEPKGGETSTTKSQPGNDKGILRKNEFQMKQITIPQKDSYQKGEPSVKRLSNAEFRVRLDKGLCFRCNEKYSHGHRCKVKEKRELMLFILNEEESVEEGAVSEGREEERVELQQLDIIEEAEVEYHAFTSLSTKGTMKLKGYEGEGSDCAD
ncbi:retrotransposon protein [Cucumis melo var. makuwa]|uniref:Retrotransposon protein n=1 Tax=Cucumis melo var. makuwa TaxID=1194695 RepID=A0A5D3BI69_CUCMM|nr:retrotransposon protein [Cucumis melo var. makuwa]